MTSLGEFGPCGGCGLELPELDAPTPSHLGASPACWAIYGRLLVREYSQATSRRAHRLTLDSYAVQHPGVPGRRAIQSVNLHLIGLCLLLERGTSEQTAARRLARILERPPPFRWLEPPAPNGTLTISDAVAAPTPEARARAVERWAQSVWDAWTPHHAVARGWIDAGLSES